MSLTNQKRIIFRAKAFVMAAFSTLSTMGFSFYSSPAYAAGRELIVTKSHTDGKDAKAYFIAPTKPTPRGPSTLVVYYHGMVSNIDEPFTLPPGAPIGPILTSIYPHFGFLSVGIAHSWCDPAALADVADAINVVQTKYNFDRIVYIGASMGGCSLLSFINQAPDNIKSKSESILTILSCGDLANLYKLTKEPLVKESLEKVMGGTPAEAKAEYRARSFIPNIKKFPKSVKVIIVSHMEDTTMPPKLQLQLKRALEGNGNKVKFTERKGTHGTWPTPTQFQYYIEHIVHKNLM
jgi:hypothetical protein